ncbi:unnamed protein product [Pleuronectes platessa]|uniref:Uncharacterized protein n=1 Tax=Pleuronectes platessa TaxID=8262 RepID=A0A9N7VI85_PLEPL|nr:unnamed protein product [Pleuronectes platessa]
MIPPDACAVFELLPFQDHFLILSKLSLADFCGFPPPPLLAIHLPHSPLFALSSCLSSFNTCQDSSGPGSTARISFERAPQDVIIRIITGPYG